MVEIAIVENHKENIVFDPNGYRLRDLEKAFAAGPDAEHAESRPAFSAQPAAPTNDADPLSAALSILDNQRLNGPFVGIEEKLVPDIEACLCPFVSWKLYRNDMRYIKLWLEYSRLSEAPLRVFEYMQSQHIGSFSALFFEQWANFYEASGSRAAAVRVLTRGIKNGAQPLSLLEFAKEATLERESVALQPKAGIAHPPPKRHRVPGAAKGGSHTKKLKVFEDRSDSESDASDDDYASAHNYPRSFPYVSSERRENKMPVEGLAGQVLIQSHSISLMKDQGEPVMVFRDHDDDDSATGLKRLPDRQVATERPMSRSFKLMLLEERDFTYSMRKFNNTPQPLSTKQATCLNNATGIVTGLDSALISVLYTQHAGHTEPIQDIFGAGPATEQLG